MEEKEFRFPNKEDKAWCPFIVHESGYIEVLGKKALTWSECEGLITQLEKKFKGEDKKYGIMEYESVPVFLGKTIVVFIPEQPWKALIPILLSLVVLEKSTEVISVLSINAELATDIK